MTRSRWLLPVGALVCALPVVPAPVALGLGALVGLGAQLGYERELRGFTQKLLAGAVVALGAGVNLREVARVGFEGASLTVCTIAICLGVGHLLTRLLGVDARVGLLIAVGTAICGGSAIAAVAPAVRAKDEETSIALGTVFLLNAVALVVLPFVGRAFALDADHFGLYAALAVHDTSSVIGAAMSFGDRAVEVATTVKLARATWIVPVALIAGLTLAPRTEGEAHVKPERPWFILGFLGCAAFFTLVPGLEPIRDVASFIARRAMVVTLFFVGAGLSRDALRRAGFRPLLLGAALWCVIAVTSLALVMR